MLLLNKVVHGLFVIHQQNPWVSCSANDDKVTENYGYELWVKVSRYWQINFCAQIEYCRPTSGNHPAPLIERTYPEIPVMIN